MFAILEKSTETTFAVERRPLVTESRMTPNPELKLRLLAAAGEQKSATRGSIRARWMTFVAVMVVAWIAVTVALGPRLGPRPLWYVIALAAGWSLVAASSTFIAWSSRRTIGVPRG